LGPLAIAGRLAVMALLGWLALAVPASAQTSPFNGWAAVIVAGDWHTHSGKPSAVFDNARRDLGKAFVGAGFSPDNISQFSVHDPASSPGAPLKSEPAVIFKRLDALAQQAKTGCLVYFTSHGSPDGILVGDFVWPPGLMAQMVDATCGARPTVVVIAACFSGVFVPPLSAPNRMVLTAARPDRASFGCGEADRYTFFDTCMLGELPRVHDFAALAVAVQACVARREKDLGASPPSEPQLDIGVRLRPILPLYAFAKSPDAPASAECFRRTRGRPTNHSRAVPGGVRPCAQSRDSPSP
jgi:hypothetical protein